MKTTYYYVIRKEDGSVEARFLTKAQTNRYIENLASQGEAWQGYEVKTQRQYEATK